MKRNLIITLLSAALAAAPAIHAKVAKQGIHNLQQPDGTTVEVVINGGPRTSWYTTPDGYLLLANEQGVMEYAHSQADGKIVPSGRKAVDSDLRSADDRAFLESIKGSSLCPTFVQQRNEIAAQAQGPGLFPGTAFPSFGQQKVLVILVQYTDVSFTVSSPKTYFKNQLNKSGFSQNGATGSARDFFVEGSKGAFLPDMDVYGPVTLSQNQAYYGGNNYAGDDLHPGQMVTEACQQLDGDINFKDYDRDNDGYVDNVYIIYAGKGEADGGGSNTVWPHSWTVSSATGSVLTLDGVKIDRYACSNEWDNYANRPDGIGTFCHEFSHVMGLPDLYATSYSGAFTPHDYSVMDYGPYNNDGRTPPTYSAFERYALGWIDPIEITGRSNQQLQHIMTSNQACIINTGDPNEYFLFENRQQKGSDAYIPGHGMLVWHVQYNESVWNSNRVNNSTSKQYVDIEEADNLRTSNSRDGDTFPGTAGVTTFTDDTAPNMRTWSNAALGLPITEIEESSDGVITFKVCGGFVHVDAPTLHNATAVGPYSFEASWTAVSTATNYRVTLTRESVSGEVAVGSYTDLDVGKVTSYKFTSLSPQTVYYLTVVAENDGSMSAPSNKITVKTSYPEFEESRVELAEPTEVSPTSMIVNWERHPEATGYEVSVYEREVKGVKEDVCDFTDGVTSLPEGWTCNTTYAYYQSAYVGAAAPAAKLAVNGASVESPVFGEDVESISFWHRGDSNDPGNMISLMGLVGSEWTILGEYTVTGAKGGRTIAIESLPEGVRAVRIIYVKSGAGYLALDDIVIKHGGTVLKTYVDGCQYASAGNVTSYEVKGLLPSTTYYYSVRGVKGSQRTLDSLAGNVTTPEGDGIDTIGAPAASGAAAAPLYDLQGRPVTSASPAPGVYISRQGGKAVKVLVR